MSALIGEFLGHLLEVGKLLLDSREILDGMKDVSKGKKPFMGPEEMQAKLAKLNDYGKKLETLGSKGIGQPIDKKVSMDELANPKTKSQAIGKFKDNLKTRDAFVVNGEKLVAALKSTEKEALARSQTSREVSQVFKKMVESPLPDLGTLGKSTYFGYYQLFEQAAGTFGNLANYAKRAQAKVAADVTRASDDTENMRDTLKTFGIK